MHKHFNKTFTTRAYQIQKLQDDIRSILIYMDSARLAMTNIEDAMSMIKIARDKTRFVSSELTKINEDNQ